MSATSAPHLTKTNTNHTTKEIHNAHHIHIAIQAYAILFQWHLSTLSQGLTHNGNLHSQSPRFGQGGGCPLRQGQFNKAVGGYLEAAPLIPAIKTSEPYVIDLFVDEEGLLKSLPINTRLSFFCSAFLAGNAVFAAHDNMGETVGLTKADAESIVKTINNVGV